MKRAIVASAMFVFLFPFVSLAQSALDDAGCTNTAEGYVCPQSPPVTGVEATYLDDVECYSTANATCTADCSALVDVGCFGFVKINKDARYSSCSTLIGAAGVSYNNNCRAETLGAGTSLAVLINPDIIDYSSCSKAVEGDTYVIHCPYLGRVQQLNASVDPDGLIVLEAADIPGISLETVLIIALVAAIALVAVWVLRPAKAGAAAGERRPRRRERRQ